MKKADNRNIKPEDKKKNNEEEQENKKRYWIYLLLFTIILFFATFGMTYSIYRGDNPDDHEIQTGQIIFSYSDVSDLGNGIKLTNALPITDGVGKSMVGKGQYFDFYVNATTRNSKINYQLLINKDGKSTLSDNKVKLYLTGLSGSYEQELLLTKVSDLKTININNQKYYILYEKTLQEQLENYYDSYRLRMWIDESAMDYESQFYSIKVDVRASQVED